MSLLEQKTVITDDGIYPPRFIQLKTIFALLLLIATMGVVFLGKLNMTAMLVQVGVVLLMLALHVNERRKFGVLGQPYVSIIEGQLLIAHIGDTRGGILMPVSELKQLVIYGALNHRIYRCVNMNGKSTELIPVWPQAVHVLAEQFLFRRLPEKVIVEEAQTTFAAIRGDGPVTES
ncbi:hypothetical protein [Undibacterium sp. TJN19]|uniref:hypothetical protein n=1 Tax=Undibacterium sp. TJN19 TaxID=3413055 RepID=UPI003BF0E982